MTPRYNWDKIKLEYYGSPIMDVKWFFKVYYRTYSGHVRTMTRWWSVDKQVLIQSCKDQAEKELKEKMKEIFKPQVEELSQIYKAVFYVIKAKAFSLRQSVTKDEKGNIIVPKDLKLSEVKILWEIIRTEMGLPTKFTHSKVDVGFRNNEGKENIFFSNKSI